jgi:hypothetical protein
VLREGGAHGRDGVGKAGLVQGDHVQVAFDEHHLVAGADLLASPVEAVKQPPFIEDRGLGRVQELGDILGVEDARPKARHAAALIADGEHDSVAEAVVDAARPGLRLIAWALGDQTGFDQVFLRIALLLEVSQGSFPGVGCIAQTEGLDGLVAQAALVEVLEGGLTGRGVQQMMAVEGDSVFEQGTQVVVLFGGGLIGRGGGLELHAGALCQVVQGFGEVPALFLHHKAEDIAALVALPKTAPGARFGEDHEGRGARVGMEGTKARIALPRAAELHRLRDEVYDLNPGLDLIDRGHKYSNYTRGRKKDVTGSDDRPGGRIPYIKSKNKG